MAAGARGPSFEARRQGRRAPPAITAKPLREDDVGKIFAVPQKFNLDNIPIETYHEQVLSSEGALSRSDPSADRAKAGRTGAPRNGRRTDGRWSAGRRCALPWARAVPCRARWVR